MARPRTFVPPDVGGKPGCEEIGDDRTAVAGGRDAHDETLAVRRDTMRLASGSATAKDPPAGPSKSPTTSSAGRLSPASQPSAER